MTAQSITESELPDADPAEPVTLRDLVARNVRRLRLAGNAEHDDVSRAAARYGLEWTPQWVAGVERGRQTLTAEQLLGLPIVLTDAIGFRVGLADLLVGEEPVSLAKVAATGATARSGSAAGPAAGAVPATYLRELVTADLSRRAFAAPGTPFAGVLPADSVLSKATAKMHEIGRAGLGDVDVRALARAEGGAGDLEEKLARKLGVAPIVVIAAAASLWGRSMTEERDVRLAEVTDIEGEYYEAPKPAPIVRRLTAALTARIHDAATRADALPEEAPPAD